MEKLLSDFSECFKRVKGHKKELSGYPNKMQCAYAALVLSYLFGNKKHMIVLDKTCRRFGTSSIICALVLLLLYKGESDICIVAISHNMSEWYLSQFRENSKRITISEQFGKDESVHKYVFVDDANHMKFIYAKEMEEGNDTNQILLLFDKDMSYFPGYKSSLVHILSITFRILSRPPYLFPDFIFVNYFWLWPYYF